MADDRVPGMDDTRRDLWVCATCGLRIYALAPRACPNDGGELTKIEQFERDD